MPPAQPQQMTAAQWLQLVLLGIIWGGSFFFAKVALAQYGPLTIVLARSVIGLAVLGAVVALLRLPLPREPRFYGWLLVMGLLNNLLPMTLLFWAEQQEVPSGLVATINATTPLWGVLLAHYALRTERVTLARGAGVLVGFAGVALISLAGPVGGNLLAQAAALVAALLYAVAGFYARRFRGQPVLLIATGQIAATTLMLLPLASLVERPWAQGAPQPAVLAALAGLGLLCTALAYVMYFNLLETAGTSNSLLVTFVIPISAVLLGWLFLGERLALRHLAGMALVLAGLLILDGRVLRRRPM